MSAVLPDRWNGIPAELVHETARTMVEADRQGRHDSRKGWMLSGVGLVAVLVLMGLAADKREAQGKSSVTFGRGTVISTESTGTGARLGDFSPVGGVRPAAAAAAATPSPTPSMAPTTRPTAEPRPRPRTTVAAGYEVLISEQDLQMALREGGSEGTRQERELGAPAESSGESPAAVLNVGTRVPVILLQQVTTGPAGAIASARLKENVTREGRVVIPAGASLEGEAFATTGDDRVQVVFRSLVVGARTVPIHGVAFDLTGEQGLSGKVLKKGRGRAGLGRLLGSAARVASLGLVGGGSDFGVEVAEDLARNAARDASELERRWTRSDKVVRVPGGTPAVLYLAADVRIQ